MRPIAKTASTERGRMGVKGLKKLAHQRNPQAKRPIFAKRDTKEHKKGTRTRKHKGQATTVNIKNLRKYIELPDDVLADLVEAKQLVAREVRTRGRARGDAMEV